MTPRHDFDTDTLRILLTKELGRAVSQDEARRIGQFLLDFYEHLAATPASDDEVPKK